MTPEHEKRLESSIDRELEALPDLTAPATLISRVMSAIENHAYLPWFRQSWPMWPQGLRIASLALALALFGGLCFGSWELWHSAGFAAASHTVSGWMASFSAIWNALNVLFGSIVLAAKQLSSIYLIACLVALAFAYILCVGLGTLYVRLGLTRS